MQEVRESEGFCRGRSLWLAPPERPMCIGTGEVRAIFAGARAVGRPVAHRWAEPYGHAVAGFECERICCDPKDGELCLRRVKPEETLVEARSGSDVQIDRRTWV